MYRFLWLFILVPCFSCAQEQVSDYDKFGVFTPSDLNRQLGFAQIDGVDYMLQEDDSLTIYRWTGDQFDPLHVVPQFHKQNLNEDTMDPNRSQMRITNGKYYRILEEGIQVIDVASGTIEAEYNSELDGWSYLFPLELYEDQLYFIVNKSSTYVRLVLDCQTNEIDTFPSRIYSTAFRSGFIGGTHFELDYSGELFVTNMTNVQDSLLADFGFNSQGAIISRVDSSFVVVDEIGDVWTVGLDFDVVKTACNLTRSTELEAFFLKGSDLITTYKTNTGYDIVVYDLDTGQVELEFDLPVHDNNYHAFELVPNNGDERFSILGYYLPYQFDNLINASTYHIIDHQNNSYAVLPEVQRMRLNTPFLHNDKVYFVAYDELWSDVDEYLARYDLSSGEYLRLDPDNGLSLFATLGYLIDDSIIAATNTQGETPQVWQISPEDSMTLLQPIDFLDNLGLLDIKHVIPMEDRFYFSNNSGVFSTLHETRMDINIENEFVNQRYYPHRKMSSHGDKITYVNIAEGNATFNILDTKSGVLEKVAESNNNRTGLNYVLEAGPYYLFTGTDFSGALQYLDIRTGEIKTIDGPSRLDVNYTAVGSEKVLLREPSFNADDEMDLYLIDYETNVVEEYTVDFAPDRMYAGKDDAFYFFDRDHTADSMRIYILTEDWQIQNLFEVKGNYRSSELHAYDDRAGITFFNLKDDDDKAIIIANDLDRTEVINIDEIKDTKIVHSYKDKLLLIGEDSLRDDRVYLYQAFDTLQRLEMLDNLYLTYIDIADSLTHILYTAGGETFIFKHDNETGQSQVNQVTDFYSTCDGGIRVDDNTYLLAMGYSPAGLSDSEYEPWLLNLETNEFEILTDPNGGSCFTAPENFINFKDWTYFSAVIEAKGRQWFRLGPASTSYTLELVSPPTELMLYPNPSASSFRLDKDLERLCIYNMEGQMVKELGSYTQGQQVQIRALANGIYHLIGFDSEGQRCQTQLVKVGE